ncbi:hypothetical protein F-LCD7_0035 [Faustovirus]|nr:hypothetical protein F-LCD7_0035 [Faustovirus]QJX72796.1 hypothetical protein F-VV57_0034 [Faustovirus]QJX73301.1 hypothetical protein F-VV63_0035 [Faustovirus]
MSVKTRSNRVIRKTRRFAESVDIAPTYPSLPATCNVTLSDMVTKMPAKATISKAEMIIRANRLYSLLTQHVITQKQVALRVKIDFRKINKFILCLYAVATWQSLEPIVTKAIDELIREKKMTANMRDYLFDVKPCGPKVHLAKQIVDSAITAYAPINAPVPPRVVNINAKANIANSTIDILDGIASVGANYEYQPANVFAQQLPATATPLRPLSTDEYIDTWVSPKFAPYQWIGLNLEV